MTAMVHSSPYVSSRSRGYNPRSPSITNGYAFVLLLSALATAVAFSGTSHSIVYSTYNENAPAAYKAKAKVLYFHQTTIHARWCGHRIRNAERTSRGNVTRRLESHAPNNRKGENAMQEG